MRQHYIWLLKRLKKEKVIRAWEVVTYQGKIPSFNKMWAGMHWRSRKQLADAYHTVFRLRLKQQLKKKYRKEPQFSVYIFYNSRHDLDNIVAIEKLFVDTLVRENYVAGDSKAHYKSMVLCPDEKLKTNTVEFYFVPHAHEIATSI